MGSREKANEQLRKSVEVVVFLDGSGKTMSIDGGVEEFMADPVKSVAKELCCEEDDVVEYYKGEEPWGCQRCTGATAKGTRCTKQDTRQYVTGIAHWLELKRSGWTPRCPQHRGKGGEL